MVGAPSKLPTCRRQPAGVPSAGNILKGLERLTFLRSVGIPTSWSRYVHQNRLLQIARERANTGAAHLREFGEERQYATLHLEAFQQSGKAINEKLHLLRGHRSGALRRAASAFLVQ